MQIPHHGITMPAVQHADGVMVDVTAEEGHSSPCTKGPSTVIARVQAGLMRCGEGYQAEGVGDIICLDGDTFAEVKIGGEWCGFFVVVKVKVTNTTYNRLDGKCEGVGTEAMCDDFTLCSIFLRCEREGNRSCSIKVHIGR
jgi:hypothetical protein